jgi:hypothetical protein
MSAVPVEDVGPVAVEPEDDARRHRDARVVEACDPFTASP